MSERYSPGDQVFIDRVLPVDFVRYTPEGMAVIRIGLDTRVVDPVILSFGEG